MSISQSQLLKKAKPGMATQINGSVVRAFEILNLFDRGRSEITASVVSGALGLNAVTAHRLLKSLEHSGALVAKERGVYRLGFALVDLGSRALAEANVAQVVQPVLDSLTRRFGEASMAMVYEADMVTCVAKAVSTRSLYVDIRIGSRLEAYCTAHGKVWLAHLAQARLDRYLDDVERQPFSGRTLTGREALLAELQAVRREGHAWNLGERESDINAVAVPVYAGNGEIVCSMSMFGPSSRLDRAALAAAIDPLKDAAQRASASFYGDAGAACEAHGSCAATGPAARPRGSQDRGA